ncbi:DUF6076 domain-containing protein [uncultured Ruminococcus sp.]|uniref:DUF6076 domain-containing protein n=1 Tax=uncultured Ruminococcus sp. TaxID=165186 RepID=UPI0025E2A7F1|nr:DUF6076 domain-containing protein [uncultured Ruminococcus sp.]
MFEIEAHYHDRKIYLSDDRTYPLGEILLRYFSMNSTALEDLYDVCERAKTDLNISSLFCPADIGKHARNIEFTYDSIMDIAEKLPPYDKKHFRRGLLRNLFAYYHDIFDEPFYEDSEFDSDDYNEHFVNAESTPVSYEEMYITEDLNELRALDDYDFDSKKVFSNYENRKDAADFTTCIEQMTNEFAEFVSDLIRVKNVFMPFADKLCDHNNYPSNKKVIEVFQQFTEKCYSESHFNLVSSGSMCMGHTLLETKKGPILCVTYRFTSLGAFLYFELFKCIEEKYMPVKCRNCGRWFIMKHTTFSHYCKRLISSNPPKSCRDNAMRHNFKEKIKNDPVWEIYNRAYKQHYARFMKKKMSKSEFAEWGEYAIQLRTKAADGELEMEEYQRLIRI